MSVSTTQRQMIWTPDLPLTVKPLIDITDQLPRDRNRHWPKRESTRRIIVHHSAVEGSIKGYANYHVNTKRRIGVCYHTIIVGDQSFQTNDWADRIDHAAYNNDDTISVCISGDFTRRQLSQGERNALYAVVLTYMDIYRVPVDLVLGHGEVRPTACPGFDMRRVREDVHALHEQLDFNRNGANVAMVVALAYRVNDLITKLSGTWANEAKRKLDLFAFVLQAANMQTDALPERFILMLYEAYTKRTEGHQEAFMQLVAIAQEAKRVGMI